MRTLFPPRPRPFYSNFAILTFVLLSGFVGLHADASGFSPYPGLQLSPGEAQTVVLNDGRAMFLCGKSGNPSAVWLSNFTPAPTLPVPNGLICAATLLSDGRLLVTGGLTSDNRPSTRVSICDPSSNHCVDGPSLPAGMYGHFMVTLPDGRVLVNGGITTDSPKRAYLFNPSLNFFQDLGETPWGGVHAAGVLLPDGRVFMVGGAVGCAVWSPATLQITRLPSSFDSAFAPDYSAATLLATGEVLIVGGVEKTLEVRIFSPTSNQVRLPSGRPLGRHTQGAQLTTLPGSTILITGGGTSDCSASGVPKIAELFNPFTEQFAPAGEMFLARAFHSAVSDGASSVLIVGGRGCTQSTMIPEVFEYRRRLRPVRPN